MGEAAKRGGSAAAGSLNRWSGARPAPDLRPALTVATAPPPPLPPRPPWPLRLRARRGTGRAPPPGPAPASHTGVFRFVNSSPSSSPRAPAPAWKLLHEPISQVETMRRWPPSGPPSRTPDRAVTPHLRLLQGNTSSPCSWIPPSQPSSFSSQSSLRPSPQSPAEGPF